jgi:dsDNA-specific endonuclease/ATPase MutS2
MNTNVELQTSFFATTVLIKLLLMNEKLKSVLPEGWEIIDRIQTRLELEVAPMSPIVKEDMQVLRRLDEIGGRFSR